MERARREYPDCPEGAELIGHAFANGSLRDNMVKETLERLFTDWGSPRHVEAVPGDGDCLFHAFSKFFDVSATHLRQTYTTYITAFKHHTVYLPGLFGFTHVLISL